MTALRAVKGKRSRRLKLPRRRRRWSRCKRKKRSRKFKVLTLCVRCEDFRSPLRLLPKTLDDRTGRRGLSGEPRRKIEIRTTRKTAQLDHATACIYDDGDERFSHDREASRREDQHFQRAVGASEWT